MNLFSKYVYGFCSSIHVIVKKFVQILWDILLLCSKYQALIDTWPKLIQNLVFWILLGDVESILIFWMSLKNWIVLWYANYRAARCWNWRFLNQLGRNLKLFWDRWYWTGHYLGTSGIGNWRRLLMNVRLVTWLLFEFITWFLHRLFDLVWIIQSFELVSMKLKSIFCFWPRIHLEHQIIDFVS